jgi:hypothetical protein
MRWMTLALRALGGSVFAIACLEVVLTLAGSHELRMSHWLKLPGPENADILSIVLDAASWLVVGVVGLLCLRLSRPIDNLLAGVVPPHWSRGWRIGVGVLAVVHVGAWVFGYPWPQRFSATVIAAGLLVWVVNRPGSTGEALRALLLRLMPETGGRGLWGSRARRRLVESLLREGQSARLLDPSVHLLMSACGVDDGRMRYFVNWDVDARFAREVESALGDVVRMRTAEDCVTAAVASSAIPVLFEPVPIAGRDHVDGGVFSNQPLHAVLADEADAVIVVLLTPSAGPSPIGERMNLLALGARLLELANWRDLQTELRSLPPGWTRDARPARVCVVEPREPLAGGVLGFEPERARGHIARGEADAARALREAGWWTPEPDAAR